MATRRTTSASPSTKRSGSPAAGAPTPAATLLAALQSEATRAGAPLAPEDAEALAGPEPCHPDLLERCAELLHRASRSRRHHRKTHPNLVLAMRQLAEGDSNLALVVRLARRRGPRYPAQVWFLDRSALLFSALCTFALTIASLRALPAFLRDPFDDDNGFPWFLALLAAAVFCLHHAYRHVYPKPPTSAVSSSPKVKKPRKASTPSGATLKHSNVLGQLTITR